MVVKIVAVSLANDTRREARAFDLLFGNYRSAKIFLRENGYSQSDPESIHWDQVNINGEDVLIVDQNIRDIQNTGPVFSDGVPNLGSFNYFVLRKRDYFAQVDSSNNRLAVRTSNLEPEERRWFSNAELTETLLSDIPAQADFSDNYFSETTSNPEPAESRWFSNAELTETLLSDIPNPDLLEGRFEAASAETNPPVNTEQFLTVGQLKAVLEGVPDDTIVSVPSWDGEENTIDYASIVQVGRIGFEDGVGLFIGDHEADDDLDGLIDIAPTVAIE